MSIIQFWWRFDSHEFASRISRLVRCGDSRFTENCGAYARELMNDTTGWEKAASNIGGWDKKSIIDDLRDIDCDSLDLAVFILVISSCKQEVDPAGLEQCPIHVPLSDICLEPKAKSALDKWKPPSTASSSFLIPNDQLLKWFESGTENAPVKLLQTAIEGDDLLCISSG